MVGKPLRLRLAAISAVAITFAALTILRPASAANCTASDRSVTVQNKSGNTIWVAALGTTQTTLPNPPTCTSNSQCQANEFCDPTVGFCRSVPIGGTVTYDSLTCARNQDCTSSESPICYTGTGKCGSLAGDGNGFELSNGASKDICVPTTWGGRMWARTGCNFTEPREGRAQDELRRKLSRPNCHGGFGLRDYCRLQECLRWREAQRE